MDGVSRGTMLRDLLAFLEDPPTGGSVITLIVSANDVYTRHPEWATASHTSVPGSMMIDAPMGNNPTDDGSGQAHLNIDAVTLTKARVAAKAKGVTVNALLHGALSVAMRLLPLPAMILVGCPVNVRTLAGVPADIVGNFAVPDRFQSHGHERRP